MKRFVVFAPSYDETSGGSLVLHKLCSLLNEAGYEAFLYRRFNGVPLYANNVPYAILRLIKSILVFWAMPYRVNPAWKTPVMRRGGMKAENDWIVIYPEVVFGNPLCAKNVVRWFLHKPGFHTRRVFFGEGEMHVDFNEFSKDFSWSGAFFSSDKLYVLSIPFEHFNMDGALPESERKGTAYCLRKGRHKKIVHSLEGSVLIDGMGHAEVAAIFKKVKRFISYDAYTAYSSFAAMCGAESVVVPDEGVEKESWYANSAERYGVAYGFDDLEWARVTADQVMPEMRKKESDSRRSVELFAAKAIRFFDGAEDVLVKKD